jgi:P4 family phage/plasmid primase-like protien
MILVTHNLIGTDRDCRAVPVAECAAYITKHKNCYERTLPATGANETDTLNRVYVDIDGKIPTDIGADDFHSLMDDVLGTLEEVFAPWETAVMTSHAANYAPTHHKASFRFHFKALCGSRDAIKTFVQEAIEPGVKDALAALPGCDEIGVDYKVYGKNRKMRMCGSSKDGETRPLLLVRGAVTDTLITAVTPDCVRLPEPPPEPIAAPKPKPPTNTIVVADPAPVVADDDIRLRVLRAISPARYDDYEDWLKVGLMCYNEGLGLDAWDALSRASSKYKPHCCDFKWTTFSPKSQRKLTIATAWKWLKTDNPAAWAELSPARTDFWTLVKEASHAECAAFFYSIKPNAYAYHPAVGWYDLLPSNIWRNSEGKDLPISMKHDIWRTFKEVANEHNAQCDLGTEQGRKDSEELGKFVKQVGNANFARGITEFIINYYHDDELPKKMSENPHLFAFQNAVFDTRTGELRPIQPTDYISNNTGYALPPRESCEADIALLRTTLWSFWEDDAILDWWAWTVANTLYGRNNHNRFYIWTGRGGNGKSMLLKLIKQTYGDYYHTFSAAVLTGKSDKKDAPLPALAQSKGKRFAAATEPDDASGKFQAATVKSFTGNEEVRAREMYKTDVTFTPQFTLFVACNDIPTYTKIDGGVIRRQRVLRFPFDFTQPTPTEPHHRRGDKSLDARFESDKTLAHALAWMLIDTFKKPAAPEPESIKKATDDETENNLPVKQWLTENYVLHCDPKKDYIRSAELLAAYNAQAETRLTAAVFKSQCDASGLAYERKGDGRYFVGLREKPPKPPTNDIIQHVPGGEDEGEGYGGL